MAQSIKPAQQVIMHEDTRAIFDEFIDKVNRLPGVIIDMDAQYSKDKNRPIRKKEDSKSFNTNKLIFTFGTEEKASSKNAGEHVRTCIAFTLPDFSRKDVKSLRYQYDNKNPGIMKYTTKKSKMYDDVIQPVDDNAIYDMTKYTSWAFNNASYGWMFKTDDYTDIQRIKSQDDICNSLDVLYNRCKQISTKMANDPMYEPDLLKDISDPNEIKSIVEAVNALDVYREVTHIAKFGNIVEPYVYDMLEHTNDKRKEREGRYDKMFEKVKEETGRETYPKYIVDMSTTVSDNMTSRNMPVYEQYRFWHIYTHMDDHPGAWDESTNALNSICAAVPLNIPPCIIVYNGDPDNTKALEYDKIYIKTIDETGNYPTGNNNNYSFTLSEFMTGKNLKDDKKAHRDMLISQFPCLERYKDDTEMTTVKAMLYKSYNPSNAKYSKRAYEPFDMLDLELSMFQKNADNLHIEILDGDKLYKGSVKDTCNAVKDSIEDALYGEDNGGNKNHQKIIINSINLKTGTPEITIAPMKFGSLITDVFESKGYENIFENNNDYKAAYGLSISDVNTTTCQAIRRTDSQMNAALIITGQIDNPDIYERTAYQDMIAADEDNFGAAIAYFDILNKSDAYTCNSFMLLNDVYNIKNADDMHRVYAEITSDDDDSPKLYIPRDAYEFEAMRVMYRTETDLDTARVKPGEANAFENIILKGLERNPEVYDTMISNLSKIAFSSDTFEKHNGCDLIDKIRDQKINMQNQSKQMSKTSNVSRLFSMRDKSNAEVGEVSDNLENPHINI